MSNVKNLVLFLDGTWNEPESNTNVWKLYRLLADEDEEGRPQVPYYDPGVGTSIFDRFTGGAFGRGLYQNVQQAYRFIAESYDEDDRIYLFGFSRGAFTARSIAGMIAHCGILTPDAPISLNEVFTRYRSGATPLHGLIRNKAKKDQFTLQERLLLQYTYPHRRNLIKMVGVWDTVGSIGVPFGRIPGVSRNTLTFHSTRLSHYVHHAYQALAIDEYRKPYWAMLWTQFEPKERSPRTRPDNRWVEQRWFTGAHADVGGGYASGILSQRPLLWMQKKAERCGLRFRRTTRLHPAEFDYSPHDSYSEFLKGAWRIVRLGRTHLRPVIPAREDKGTGWVSTVNERIDDSVFTRCKLDPSYRPKVLIQWLERAGFDLESLLADQGKREKLSSEVNEPGVLKA